MKRVKKYLLTLALVTCLAVLLPNSSQAATKASIKLNKTKATIYVGKSLQLKATVTGKSKKVSWRSSNKNVAVVTSKGKVTAKKVGKVRVIAKANGKSKSCSVTVKKKSKPSKQTVQKAYKNYFNRNFKGNSMYRDGYYNLYDINKDGVSEMIVVYPSGVRAGCQLFTYKNGKIVKMHNDEFYGCNGIYKAKNNVICIQGSGGAASTSFTFYKMKGTKLKRIVKYTQDGDVFGRYVHYYRNNKRISAAEFRKVTLGMDYTNSVSSKY